MKVLLSIIFIIFILLLFITTSVPSGKDMSEISYVGSYIQEKYGKFEERDKVEKNHTGKTYYTRPSPSTPTIIFYEITSYNEINMIETLTKEALQTAEIDKVKLEFYEKQNFTYSSGGTLFSRENENLIKEVKISL